MGIQQILTDHARWIETSGKEGTRADLTDVDLEGADLTCANLAGAKLSRADLTNASMTGANLAGAILTRADLTSANLAGADLTGAVLADAILILADLAGANLTCANLTCANLAGAILTRADLTNASMTCANLAGAILTRADLTNASMTGANLSQTTGLLTARRWMAENLEKNQFGYICYKRIGNTPFKTPSAWVIEPGAFIEDTVDPSPCALCGCGVNVGTLDWCYKNYQADLWRCRIRWEDLPDVVVPYCTDGRFRCGRLELLEKIENAG